MTSFESPFDASALELAAAFARGDTSPSKAVDAYLERIEEHSETLGAFVRVTADPAHAAAEAATKRYRDGEPVSPLDGVPTAIKDLASTEGVVTRFGSATYG